MTTAASTPQEEPVREAEADLLARRRAAAVGDVYDCGEADAEHPAVCDVDGGAGRHARRAEPVHGGEDVESTAGSTAKSSAAETAPPTTPPARPAFQSPGSDSGAAAVERGVPADTSDRLRRGGIQLYAAARPPAWR